MFLKVPYFHSTIRNHTNLKFENVTKNLTQQIIVIIFLMQKYRKFNFNRQYLTINIIIQIPINVDSMHFLLFYVKTIFFNLNQCFLIELLIFIGLKVNVKNRLKQHIKVYIFSCKSIEIKNKTICFMTIICCQSFNFTPKI